jgi:hypothetical protein
VGGQTGRLEIDGPLKGLDGGGILGGAERLLALIQPVCGIQPIPAPKAR